MDGVSRRELLVGTAGMILGDSASGQTKKVAMDSFRIRKLKLKTGVLDAQVSFYRDTIGLAVLSKTADSIAFAAGPTVLEFERAEAGTSPWYHFAFNIPENKILAARSWQLRRTPLMPIPPHLRASGYPDDVVDFSHWNAHSVFFFDPAGNVVEYIARHDLRNDRSGSFEPHDIFGLSEIGLIVDDVPAMANQTKAFTGFDSYLGAGDEFHPIGDEHGLLLIMKIGRHLDFAADTKKEAKVFPTVVDIQGAPSKSLHVPGYPYELSCSGR